MTTIKSEIIGVLRQNDKFDDWWESELIEIPFFDNKKLKITFTDLNPSQDLTFIQDADIALRSFLEKRVTNRLTISDAIFKNCMDFLKAVEYDEADKMLWDIQYKEEIWNFVYPENIYVSRSDADIYINAICECEWEHEHGLQLVFFKGIKLTRVSSQDGHLTESEAYNINENELIGPNSKTKGVSKPNTWWKKFWT